MQVIFYEKQARKLYGITIDEQVCPLKLEDKQNLALCIPKRKILQKILKLSSLLPGKIVINDISTYIAVIQYPECLEEMTENTITDSIPDIQILFEFILKQKLVLIIPNIDINAKQIVSSLLYQKFGAVYDKSNKSSKCGFIFNNYNQLEYCLNSLTGNDQQLLVQEFDITSESEVSIVLSSLFVENRALYTIDEKYEPTQYNITIETYQQLLDQLTNDCFDSYLLKFKNITLDDVIAEEINVYYEKLTQRYQLEAIAEVENFINFKCFDLGIYTDYHKINPSQRYATKISSLKRIDYLHDTINKEFSQI
ncbi:hypothetical protein SS50377_20957 [Spironucleus salmonicida]|uniref:Uncharacterized protein n=1 Tax=Spironucleus salmonicida TaxID=348837 RepID=V6LGH3_9EUKA|nr:hypothetical protein SS50377_20957 [Spironucleus salmonicida]|eukprot:EST43627.1 Hypothetical protein SS50377_16670 [Spironucleus salmonicida]